MEHDVFISYSSKNKTTALAMCHVLEQHRIKCWIAPRDIPPGADYADVIDEAIIACRVFIIIFSEPASVSQWVKGELNLAFTEEKHIVPYRIDDTRLKGAMRLILNHTHWIEAYPDAESKFDELVSGIARYLDIQTVAGQPQTDSSPVAAAAKPESVPTPKPSIETINGHYWVDLGLSVKWATCNVGASSPEEYGNHYAWGETTPKSEYIEENCKTWNKDLGDIAGNSQYDAARANWGSTWRLPTSAEMWELITKCTWTWTTQGGHIGCMVTGPNGNSIFLPAAGWRYGSSLNSASEYGYYWCSMPNESNMQGAYYLYFSSRDHNVSWYYRDHGRSVRPVIEKTNLTKVESAMEAKITVSRANKK